MADVTSVYYNIDSGGPTQTKLTASLWGTASIATSASFTRSGSYAMTSSWANGLSSSSDVSLFGAGNGTRKISLTATSAGSGVNLVLSGSDANGTIGVGAAKTGGNIFIVGGYGIPGATATDLSQGGNITIQGGVATGSLLVNTGSGGDVTLYGGYANVTGSGGRVILRGGESNNPSGTTGSIILSGSTIITSTPIQTLGAGTSVYASSSLIGYTTDGNFEDFSVLANKVVRLRYAGSTGNMYLNDELGVSMMSGNSTGLYFFGSNATLTPIGQFSASAATITGKITTAGITGSLWGTSSFTTSASFLAGTASFARSGSWANKVSGSVTGSTGILLLGNIQFMSSSARIGHFGTVSAGTARVEVEVGSFTIRGEDVDNVGNFTTQAFHGGNIVLLAGTGSGFGVEDRTGDGGNIVLRGGVGVDNDGAQQRGGNVYLIGGFSAGSGVALNGFVHVTGSSFTSQCGLTSSLRGTASFASSASYIVANRAYTTLTSGSDNYITCSFGIAEQYFDLTTGLNYTITCSNPPPANRLSDIRIFVNNTAAATSSLTFGAGWKNLSGGWPVSITSSKSFMVVLTAYGPTTVVGSFIAEV